MDVAEGGTSQKTLWRALAGLQAGVTGSLLMLAWSILASVWDRRSIWTIPNLYATTFYGSSAYVDYFRRGSLGGVALMVLICGIGGIVWSLVLGEKDRPFLGLHGAVIGLGVYYLLFSLIARFAFPIVTIYAPTHQLQFGYVLWGIALAGSPRRTRELIALSDALPRDRQ